jgi:oligoribonuclease (3'-5' exoribonuclease)
MGKPKYLQSPEQLLKVFSGKDILVFDTETTGLFSNAHQITELAAEVVDGDTFTIKDSFHMKVHLTEKTLTRIKHEKENPKKDSKLYTVEQCLTLNGYNFDDPDHKNLDDVLISFYNFCEKHTAIIVGQSARFDLDMVNTSLKKIFPGKVLKNTEVYDTKLFFAIYVIPALQALKERGDEGTKKIIEDIWDHEKNRPSSRLGLILKAFDIQIVGWHGAPADVKSTILALKKILDFIRAHSDIVSDPIFLKERGINYHKEVGENKERDKKQKRDFYRKDQLKNIP